MKTADVPDVFKQAELPKVAKTYENRTTNEDGDCQVMAKITGALVDMLAQLKPNLHSENVERRLCMDFACVCTRSIAWNVDNFTVVVQEVQKGSQMSWVCI